MSGVLTERGGSVAAIASGSCQARSVVDCDRALKLLRIATRCGSVEQREVAWLSIDAVLDRRLELRKISTEGGR